MPGHKHGENEWSNRIRVANEREVFALRRKISPESYPYIMSVLGLLRAETTGHARLFDAKMLSVTVLGFSNFSDEHIMEGPPTREIVGRVSSMRQRIAVRLGEVSIFGAGSVKLGFNFEGASGSVTHEHNALADEIGKYGFQLVYPFDDYVPHLSVALIFNDRDFGLEDRCQRRLNKINNILRSKKAKNRPRLFLEPPRLGSSANSR